MMAQIGIIRMDNKFKAQNNSGFTLIELMLAMLISLLILGTMFVVNRSQSESYRVQEEIAQMQQNIRAGLGTLQHDIRKAGYDPTRSANTGFVNGHFTGTNDGDTVTIISFTADLDGDGTIDTTTEDNNNDGMIDISDMEQISYRLDTSNNLQRYSNVPATDLWNTVAESIDNIEFDYLDNTGNSVAATSSNIRAVRISILARAEETDPTFTNSKVYTTGAGVSWDSGDDNYRRRLMVTKIACRNMGI